MPKLAHLTINGIVPEFEKVFGLPFPERGIFVHDSPIYKLNLHSIRRPVRELIKSLPNSWKKDLVFRHQELDFNSLEISKGYPKYFYDENVLIAVQLRPFAGPNLLVGCGNGPLKPEFQQDCHHHSNITTIDLDFTMNPSIIGNAFEHGLDPFGHFDVIYLEGVEYKALGPLLEHSSKIRTITRKEIHERHKSCKIC
jgi:hypothetical protein